MNFDELKQQCLACQRCGLCETRTHVVFGQGVPDAEVLFVGEGPGANEDAQGLPFVGRSGQLLDQKTATLPRKNPPPASRGCAYSSGCCAQKLWCAWAALLPSR